MAEVRLERVCKSFGRESVIRNIDLSITDGEFCVFLGPSGCGKSTLLRLIAGLEDVTSGRIHIGGTDVTGLPPKGRHVAMVFQSYALYPHMTAYQNMAFGLRLGHRRRQEVDRRVRQTARNLHIEHLLDRKPAELSGGQQQRVAIGRAVVREPRVFLFDEPLSNLDTDLRARMRAEFSRLHRRLGNTMIYVTHDQTEAMTLADRLVLIREGEVAQAGPPLALYQEPESLFAATFLGTPRMNLIPARLTRGARDLATLELPDGSEHRARVAAGEATAGAPVTLGLRPEALRLDDRGPNVVAGAVSLVEQLGDHALVHVDWHERTDSIVVRAQSGTLPGTAQPLRLSFAPEACHLFDQDGRAFTRIGRERESKSESPSHHPSESPNPLTASPKPGP